MSTRLHPAGQATAIALAAFVGACASQPGDEELIACPPAQIAVPADRIGNNNADDQLRYVATMEQLVSNCRIDEDDLEVDLALTFSVERGPAFDDQPVELFYFLATVDPRREIIDKHILDVTLDIGPDQPSSTLREEVTLRLPVATEASGANYSLYLGFQPDQRPRRAEATAPRPTVSSTSAAAPEPATPVSAAPSTAAADAVEITFPINSSVFPDGVDDQLSTLLQGLDKSKRYVLHVETSVDRADKVPGAASDDETEQYNLWLAERRYQRVEAWFRENADDVDVSLEPSLVENDGSRRVRIEPRLAG